MLEKQHLNNKCNLNPDSAKSNTQDRVYMLTVVWFKGKTGEYRYRDYLREMSPLISKVGGRKLKSFIPERGLIGEFDADLLYFVEYPNWQAFKDFANSADYHRIAYIREEALDKQLLIRCGRPDRSFWG